MWRRLPAFVAISLLISLSSAHRVKGQASSSGDGTRGNLPKFDVVSIKPGGGNTSGFGMSLLLTPDGISAAGVPFQMILTQAFGVPDDRIIGAPSWSRSDLYDIQAKVAAEDAPRLQKLNREQRWGMLQPVLQERFHLKFHNEMQDRQVYALVIAKGGPKISCCGYVIGNWFGSW